MNFPKINLKKLIFGGLFAVFAIYAAITLITFFNQTKRIDNQYTKKFKDRTADLSNMKSTISMKGQTARMNDSSFTKNIGLIMEGRKDSKDLAMKWIQEVNPNANFGEVADMYKDLSRYIESKKEEFLSREEDMSSIAQTKDDIITTFPSNMYSSIFGVKRINHKPIVSDRAAEAARTGRDNDERVF